MPRSLASKTLANRAWSQVKARAYPSDNAATVTVSDLQRKLFTRPPKNDQYRNRFGRALTLDRIEQALTSAQDGAMRDLTDLSRETIDTDPHLASVLQKRIGAVASRPWEVIPASGLGIDQERADFYAQVVRDQLVQIARFHHSIAQLAWGLFDGRSVLENDWILIGNGIRDARFGAVRWAIRGLGWIHPRRLCFGPARELRVNDSYVSGPFAPVGFAIDEVPLKFIQYKPQLFGEYPEREGLAPRCLYWSFFKRFSARERMILLELFGKPWRIVIVDDESDASEDDLLAAEQVADGLGAHHTARMPRGTKLDIKSPAKSAGEIHSDVIAESDKQMSKLVLGQTGTTDGVAAGLNSNTIAVLKDEQLMLMVRDAKDISEAIEDGLTDAIIELNFGTEWLSHAPRFVLRSDIPADKKTELERMKQALDCGIAISMSEAYEVAGFRVPRDDEPVIRFDQPPTPLNAPNPPNPRPIIVWPLDEAPIGGELSPPPALPEGTPTPAPPPDPAAAPAGPQPDPVPAPGQPGAADMGTPPQPGAAASRADVYQRLIVATGDIALSSNLARVTLIRAVPDHVCLKNRQPDTVYGSPESVVERGARASARAAVPWMNALATAVEGQTRPIIIFGQLTNARERFDLHPWSRALERQLLHGLMLGSLDSNFERLEQTVISPASFASKTEPLPKFADMRFDEAQRQFKAKKILPRAEYERLVGIARRRAFSVAGEVANQMLASVHAELSKQILKGADLRTFKENLLARVKSAGFVPGDADTVLGTSASHAETVFRTNVMEAYNGGRAKEMLQPEALRTQPLWQISGVSDDRTRDPHRTAQGKVLEASDPFWQSAYPPFGFNCRCRVVSRTRKPGFSISLGSSITGLPDDGFSSGLGGLFGMGT